MENRPIEQLAALAIGTVEEVSPAEIKVLLDPNAPQATALNTGVPTGFPRINGYVLIPNETGAVVGMVVWLGVERSAYPKRTGLKDFGLVDLPFPSRKMTVTPLGTLVAERQAYRLRRGVSAFPSVGDPVLLPTARQLKSIIKASSEADQRVTIGTSPLAADTAVTVNPDKLFGRHLAVLGNTGSGKSCTVAGLIRWSLEQAKHGRKDGGRPNARFIILDPNGEYASAFSDLDAVRNFRVPPAAEGVDPLVLPAWMWNSQEWSAFAHAAPGIQRPILLQALRDMRAGAALKEPSVAQIRRLLKGYATLLETRVASGPAGYTGTREASNTGRLLSNIADDVTSRATELTDAPPLKAGLEKLAKVASDTANLRHWDKDRTRRDRGFNDFGELEIRQVLKSISDSLAKLPATEVSEAVSEDAPLPFEAVDLPDHLDRIASDSPVGQAAQFVATLSMRIRMMLADRRLGPVVNPSDTSMTFEQWLTKYVGSSGAENGELAILDLSLLPSDILHLVIAVVARVVFEALQRFRKLNGNELPTVLVLEEAHSFVRRGSDEETEIPTPAQMCRQTFERIAREGRKFGLGLVLSSQRPSELSPTVLAQCNTFILHRIVNDRDQELVGKLVPDNLGGLLKDLPSLPSRQAILLGWAAEIPTLVEITELPECQRPKSSDPEFWDVWTGRKPRDIDWERITEDWTGVSLPKTETAPTKQAVAPKTTDLPDDVRS